MAKLYFRHGVVSSAKTLNLLAVAHSYEVQNKRVLVVKPAMDTRFGEGKVKSRAGLDREADILVNGATVFAADAFQNVDCVLVDEAQFVAPKVIEQLRHVAAVGGVPVICYGLRTDFRSRLFPGSRRLMELADVIEDVKTTCTFCNRRAILNLKNVNGVPTLSGPTVCLGCEELYVPACYRHFVEKIEAGSCEPIDFEKAALEGDLADAAQAKEKQDVPESADATEFAAKEIKSAETTVRRALEPESEATPEKKHKQAYAC